MSTKRLARDYLAAMADQRPRRPFPSVAALVMAQAEQQLGEKYKDKRLVARGQSLEVRARDAIKAGKSSLDPLN